ncbi:MAG: hypothetical protein H6Q14_2236 [Bacteroidetes bacterium]|jgi:hypothetical protein|nr:hypothetical protein [Bacteroidota bacterium]
MKTSNSFILNIIILLLLSSTPAYTQSQIGAAEQDTVAVMQDLAAMKQYIGKPLRQFVAVYESILPLRFMGAGTTSPWIHPQGKAFVNDITISYCDVYELSRRYNTGQMNYYLTITFQNPVLEESSFENLFTDTMSDREKVDKIADLYIVKNISFYRNLKK